MSIQITEKDRNQCTAEYVANLKKHSRRWYKLRQLFIVVGIINFLFGIIRFNITDEDPSRWLIAKILGILFILSGLCLFLQSALQWNTPQHTYEKVKTIREILDAEEAENAVKNCQGKSKF